MTVTIYLTLEIVRVAAIIRLAAFAAASPTDANASYAPLLTRTISVREAGAARLRLVMQAQRGQQHGSETDAESLQRRSPLNRFRQTLGKLIEFIVHNFLSFCLLLVFSHATMPPHGPTRRKMLPASRSQRPFTGFHWSLPDNLWRVLI